jgi:hypothetical protein
MKKSKFSPNQIANILKELEKGKILNEFTYQYLMGMAAFFKLGL